jgi:uncharacterized RDD family membrane protein YckC
MAPPATQASRQQRLGGGLIDTLLGLCAALVLDHDGHSGDSPLIFIAGCLLLQIVAPPILGGTPGMRLQGFRLRRDDGEPPQLPQILTRAILTCAAFFLFLTWQPDGTMLHDRVTGTRIVRP